jgi:enolase
MKITGAEIKIIKDSRGQDTLEANLISGNFSAVASCPSGKSRGAHEAFVLEPKLAIKKFETIKSQVLSRDFENQGEFDGFLINLDGTPDKRNLGGNLILVLSLAFARLKAREEKKELFEYIQSVQLIKPPVFYSANFLRPVFNVINGGVHVHPPKFPEGKLGRARNILTFQEFQIIPQVKDFGMALGFGQEFYKKLKEFLEQKFGKENLSLGDEGGFSANFESDEEAIEILSEIIKKYDYPIRIGLDVAASQFQKGENYVIGGKNYSPEELKDFYSRLIKTFDILSIEDPFGEENFDDFARLSGEIISNGKLVIADDLTTTNPGRLKTAIEKKSGNAILIKLNQIGTLTETLNVVKMAYENNWQAVVSHRSGETMDDFIADLAVGIGAWGFKSGAPYPPERMVKYERVLKIIQGS